MSKEKQPIFYNEISIEMGQWNISDGSPTILETSGLGPCLGIALIDKKKKIAGLGHLPHTLYGKEKEELEKMVEEMQEKSQSFFVVLSGIGNTPGINNSEIQEHRAHVVNLLTEKGITPAKIRTFWNNNSDSSIGVAINSHTGEIELEIYDEKNRTSKTHTHHYPYSLTH